MRSYLTTAAVLALLAPVAPSYAQGTDEIRVTGSYRPANLSAPSIGPVLTVDRDDLQSIGATAFADLVGVLTINTGAENSPDAFTQSTTSGTASVNLRGLGLGSTLVLLDGRRTVASAATNNDGIAFVDLNSLLPQIAVERVEILKSGASPLYGSDAIAGVFNVIPRTNADGLELSAFFGGVAGEGESTETRFEALWGAEIRGADLLLAGAWLRQTELTTAERRLSVFGVDDVSSLGNPATFILGPEDSPSLTGPTFFIDPLGCAEFGGLPRTTGAAGPLGQPGFCRFDFGEFFTIIPEIDKHEAYASLRMPISPRLSLRLEGSYADVATLRGNSPSFPVLTRPTVPADNPFNPYGVDVGYFGRVLGTGAPRLDTPHASETSRLAAVLTWDDSKGTQAELSVLTAQNSHQQIIADVVATRLTAALNGFGGPRCDALTEVPGTGNCAYFNPFASSFSAAPNAPALTASLFEDQVRDGTSTLYLAEAFLTRPIGHVPGASTPMTMTLGAQYREESLEVDFDATSNADGFAFLVGNPDQKGDRSVPALFAELSVPVSPRLDAQLALRWEDYGSGGGDTLDPKLALLAKLTPDWYVRAAWSTSFRAPSVFQQSGVNTLLNSARDPITGTSAFVAIRNTGPGDLLPETSETVSIGTVVGLPLGVTANIDWWQYAVDDVITTESFQAVLDANPQDPSRVVRAGDPLLGPVLQINTTRFNATALTASGIDIALDTDFPLGPGQAGVRLEATRALIYDLILPNGTEIEGVGNRNFTNFGTSVPAWRGRVDVSWATPMHALRFAAQFTDAYADDQNVIAGRPAEIDAFTTLDAQYQWRMRDDIALAIGGTNLADTAPPHVATNGGYDSKVHDPRGRRLYVRLDAAF